MNASTRCTREVPCWLCVIDRSFSIVADRNSDRLMARAKLRNETVFGEAIRTEGAAVPRGRKPLKGFPFSYRGLPYRLCRHTDGDIPTSKTPVVDETLRNMYIEIRNAPYDARAGDGRI